MPAILKDKKLWIGLLLAHLWIFASYLSIPHFWGIYTAASGCLLLFTLSAREIYIKKLSVKDLLLGAISGLLLYGLFYAGLVFFNFLKVNLSYAADQLYFYYKPKELWQYFVLVFLLIPAEELFWRGFIQKRLSHYFSFYSCILLSALLYSLPMLYSRNAALVAAGLVSGLFWGFHFQASRSLPAVILSHLVFDIFLLIIFPLESGQY
ncbi:membrane protease YdiL (CAAX protease family) [Peribacillus deserti]|uniref:Membrane protease YdiL (CAAX protease family) n=1 Tax=Peribacillus deserti TaxID=673318 RepID=A0ABS2QJ17_9BACI|nr:type II CAAX endopeptidase family protein [Peribacillus deserti]MBM7693151.1 membrane protease YdiL (CAAX protease family) [Peribacillus deserti]